MSVSKGHTEITWRELEQNTELTTNFLRSLLEGTCTGLGSQCVEIEEDGASCAQEFDVAKSYTDDGAHACTQGLS